MNNTKKTLLLVSNPSFWKSGFGKHARTLLEGLYKKDKYNLIEYCASLNESDPTLQRVPWKAFGSFPNDAALIGRLQAEKNEAAINAISHGSYFIDKMVYDHKPDVVILMEDIWQIEWAFHKDWFTKINVLVWTPVDSLPLLPIFNHNKHLLKNVWVKTKFAKPELDKLGIPCEVVPALFPQDAFKPLPQEEKDQIRKLAGLEGCFVVGFVFRNQLRKLALTLLEAFKKFQERNPEVKAKLLLHTNFIEEAGHGWDIVEAIKTFGIDPNDVICTYICANCHKIAIMPFRGIGLNCSGCGSEKTLKNPTLGLGVTEEELNAIYNLFDAYMAPVTSGGFEIPMAEAMLAGIPVSTVNYSFGETFVDSGFCEPMEFDFYREGVSKFLKAQPRVNSIVEIMEKIQRDPEFYNSRALEGREWILTEFDHNKVIDKVADFIDNSSNTYDFVAPVPEKPLMIQDFINSSGSKILYVMPEGSDSCFASIPVLQSLHETYPTYDLYVGCRPEFFEIFNHLTFIKNLIPYHSTMDDFRAMEGSKGEAGLFDIVFHPSATTAKFSTFHHNGLDKNQLLCKNS